jgi:carbamoyl-phosphate synthase small subunit
VTQEAILALEDGSLFRGIAIGAAGKASGEVVFNTSMTGYQEILTDPSYAQQIVTLTYPHIGNTGINDEDNESAAVWASGLVIRDLPMLASNWRMEQTLGEFLSQRNVVAIAEIDTRRLTRLLRDKGPMNGAIVTGKELAAIGEEGAVALAREFPGLKGMDLAKVVSSSKRYTWEEGEWAIGQGHGASDESRHRVVAYDFGVKRNILRMLLARGCEVTVVPAQTPASEVMAMNPSGVFLSNGPGDPEPCDYAISAIKEFLEADMPSVRDMSWLPAAGIGLRCEYHQDAPGSSRCKPSGTESGRRYGNDNQPESWLRCRRTDSARQFARDSQVAFRWLFARH